MSARRGAPAPAAEAGRRPPPAGPVDPARGASWLLPAAVLAAVAIAAGYLHVLGAPFQFDDFDWIRDNRALGSPLDLGVIWRFWPSRFLPALSFALNILAAGRSPAALRAVNLAIHLGASLLVGAIAVEIARLTEAARRAALGAHLRAGSAVEPASVAGTGGGVGPAAASGTRGAAAPGAAAAIGLLAATIFAAHPLATQAVTYIVQRITSLTALLELAAVFAFLRARATGREPWWAACWAAALAASIGKEMSVGLPILLVMLEGALRALSAPGRATWWRLAPTFLVIPIVLALAAQPVGPEARRFTGLAATADYSRLEYALTQLTVIPRYLLLFLLPRGQQLDPWIAVREGVDGAVLGGAALLLALTALALARLKRAPLAAIGWLWFLIALAPESSLVPVGDLMNEHRAYLPMAGLVWAVAATLGPIAARRRSWLAAACVLPLVLAAVTHVRNRVWSDPRLLWGDSARKSPRSARAQNNYGLALLDSGDAAGAERAFRAAIAASPTHYLARANLGRLYGSQHRPREAVAVLEEALVIAPRDPLVLNNLGTAWWALGDTTRAAAYYARALEADPGAPYPRGNLARMRAGRPAP